MCVKVYYSCMEKVSCDLLQQEYGTLKTLAEEYKGVLLRESVGSEECQKAQKQFDEQAKRFRGLLAEFAEYYSFLQKLFLKNEKTPEIQKIFDQHDTRKAALSAIFRCREDQISTTKEEALSGGIALHDSYLDLFYLEELSAEVQLPKYIGGYLNLYNLTTLPEKVQLPEYVGGGLNLYSLTELPEGVRLPKHIGYDLDLSSLTELPNDFTFPEHIGSILFLNKKLKGHSALSTVPEGVPIGWK